MSTGDIIGFTRADPLAGGFSTSTVKWPVTLGGRVLDPHRRLGSKGWLALVAALDADRSDVPERRAILRSDGRYFFMRVAPGDYTLFAKRPGFPIVDPKRRLSYGPANEVLFRVDVRIEPGDDEASRLAKSCFDVQIPESPARTPATDQPPASSGAKEPT